jgi:hexosaminidase
VRLELGPDPGGPLAAQGYTLRIRPDQVTLTAPGEAGLLNGVQTLRQLLPPAALLLPATVEPEAPSDGTGSSDGSDEGGLDDGDGDGNRGTAGAGEGAAWWPCLDIRDRPLLPWRGLMLDVARHFMPLDHLFRLVDQLALHKFNVLHLHLTDDQGWRIEIEGLPRLTEVGSRRTASALGPGPDAATDGIPHSGHYTADQLRDLVAYAARRGINVVPEINMPGHVRALLAAHPQLGNRPERPLPVWTHWGVSEDVLAVHDQALDFCRQVLAGTMAIFPSRYIHIGGEECPTTQWHQSPAARARALELGLPSPAALHGWFLQQMYDFLAAHGRRAVCWDETGHAEGDPPAGMTLHAWRDPDHGREAVRSGHQVIMSPHRSTYLDYPQSSDPREPLGQPGEIVTVHDVYTFDPLVGGLPVADPGQDDAGVLGTQASIWTEFAPTAEHVQYLLYPRLCAMAETAWSTGPRDYDDFRSRLDHHWRRLAALGVPPRPGGAVSDPSDSHTPTLTGTMTP